MGTPLGHCAERKRTGPGKQRRCPDQEGPVHLAINQLSFRYSATDAEIFTGFNLEIAAGESIAIIGPSGQGKTTLANSC
jgi:ABC-type bacteriocin/lantibiotic exporter with double-glycine peptidase domain